MDQKERSADFTGGLKAALDGWQRDLWTCMPGIVESYDAGDNTVEVNLAIKAVVLKYDPSTGAQTPTETQISKLVKVPLHQIGNARFVVDIAPAQGDEVTVVFASRCIDGWWQSSGVQGQVEQRMHSLSDGIAIPGLFSAPTATATALGSGGMRLRDTGGGASIVMPGDGSINMTAPGGVVMTAPAGVTITASTVAIIGDLDVTGAITNNGHAVGSTHLHTGVVTGIQDSGPPV